MYTVNIPSFYFSPIFEFRLFPMRQCAKKFFSALKNLDQTQTKIIFLFFFSFWFMNLRREFELPSLSKLLVIAADFVQILYNRKQRF